MPFRGVSTQVPFGSGPSDAGLRFWAKVVVILRGFFRPRVSPMGGCLLG